MQKLLTKIAILLNLSAPAHALITEDAIVEDSQQSMVFDQKSLTLTGKGCLTTSSAKVERDFDCDRAVVTLDGSTNKLNFAFLDKKGEGIIYVTKRKAVEGVYLVTGYMFMGRSGATEEYPPVSEYSACSFDMDNTLIFCSSRTEDQKIGFSSAVIR
jgi:hypothetical protein